MKRNLISTNLGDGTTRYKLRVEGFPCKEYEAEFKLTEFLQALIDQPRLLECGSEMPQTFSLTFTGTCWCISTEVTNKDPSTS